MRAHAFIASLSACAAGPPRTEQITNTPPVATMTRDYADEACVRDFVHTQPLGRRRDYIDILRVPSHGEPTDPHYYLFHVQYGQAHDCEAGCFYSHVTGVALSCTRIGWVIVDDEENTDRAAFTMLPNAPVDPMLLDQRWWPATWTYRRFFEWLATNPAVPEATRKAAEHPPTEP